mmetsp:Transcript_53732/g.126532  ORF Transcript_53732/g.126532 Transcript_53732/m.126532 type:complete len:398 (+) Transcript_53732:526-1719(+)
MAGGPRRHRAGRVAPPQLSACRAGRCAPCLPRRRGAGLHGARRAADPRPDEGRRARGRQRRRAGHHAAPDVPAQLCGGQGGAQPHRDRQPRRQPRGRGRAPGPAAVRRPAQPARAVRRRRRDDRPCRHPFRRAEAAADERGQPQCRARPPAGRASGGHAAAAGRTGPGAGPVRHRHQLHRQQPAADRPGRRGARAQGPQAPPDADAGPGRAARHRARGGPPARRLPLHRGRPRQPGAGQWRTPPGRGGACRSHRQRRRTELCAVAGPAGQRAADPGLAAPDRDLASGRARQGPPGAGQGPGCGRRDGQPGHGADAQADAWRAQRAARQRRRGPPAVGRVAAAPLPARQRVIDARFYGLIELGLVFGLILGWAGWQWWGWRQWRRRQQASQQTKTPPD